MKLDHLQLAIPAGSETKCREFWIGLLEFAELTKPPALAARGGAWFKKDNTEIHLGVESEFNPAKKAHPAFLVDQLDDLAKRLENAGYPIRWDDDIAGRRRFFTQDPVGNRIEFIGA
ncbi:MAG: VOC family protein [Paracoccaceae bacterium]